MDNPKELESTYIPLIPFSEECRRGFDFLKCCTRMDVAKGECVETLNDRPEAFQCFETAEKYCDTSTGLLKPKENCQ